jgi:hypothetical protein
LGIGAWAREVSAVYSYDGRRFRPEDADEPVVTYWQDGDLLWAEIPAGDGVRRGSLVGRCHSDGAVDYAYCMILDNGAVVAGRCHGTPLRRRGGGIRIREEWERYGPHATTGVSYLEEVDPPPGIGQAGIGQAGIGQIGIGPAGSAHARPWR